MTNSLLFQEGVFISNSTYSTLVLMKNIHPYSSSDLSDILQIWRLSASHAYPFLKTDFFLKEETRIVSEYLPKSETWIWKDQEG
ncbi:hypothetical protein [Aquiflexum gelatinilyticum]|uniref:hypothetical protein n=1 Tax=Aquiflexum gelatinilyticum TaxID=2961943 RepID=UPI002167F7C4|nr:hypothetical protein [Aquiflexum gelatinilyticum]MCS4436174.1 hypothetical protein [Aquiflexum gelatinilyticum]